MASATATALNALGWTDGVPRLVLDPAASSLHAALCNASASSSPCSFASIVTLDANLPCHGLECAIDTSVVADVFDPVANQTVHYEYIRRPCVELTFHAGAVVRASPYTSGPKQWCADPSGVQVAAAACCPEEHNSRTIAISDCVYVNEVMSYASAVARCAARTDDYTRVCTARRSAPGCFGGNGMRDEPAWLAYNASAPTACPAQVQVFSDGRVTLVEAASDDPSLQRDSGNLFGVRWRDGSLPRVIGGSCPAGCSVSTDETCLCETVAETAAVFTDLSALPNAAQVDDQLTIGSAAPNAFADGTYARCASAACVTARAGGVTLWTHSGSAGALDDKSIFMIMRNGTRPTYLTNKASTVRIPGSGFSFRNPPKFHSFIRPSIRDAEHETEALIDHLFWHKNTAPFIARRLIQRFTSSNPSPRYILAVVDAFRAGAHGGTTFSGVYGDLGAMLAAILLDREARSQTLDADPTHGSMREPLLKLYHLLRSLEFRTRLGQQGQVSSNIGQARWRPAQYRHLQVCRAHPCRLTDDGDCPLRGRTSCSRQRCSTFTTRSIRPTVR